jgi:mannose-1-phosphate guanylyltransferase
MLPIVDQPFLAHQIAWLKRHGVTDITFACGFLPQAIVGHFGDGTAHGVRLNYVIEPEPLGTGGAIGFAARTGVASRVVVCNGDVLTTLDLSELIRFHEERGASGTIALTPVEDPTRYGLVRTDTDGAVTAFVEKPSPEEVDTNLINAGTYVLEPEVIARIPHSGQCNVEREIFPQFAGGNGLYAMASDGYWNDIGTVPSYVRANCDMVAGNVNGVGVTSHAAASGAQRLFVDSTAIISADATLVAPIWIGAGARIDAGATVGPMASVGPGAHLQAGSRVVRSVVMEQAVLGPSSQVMDAVVGEGAEIVELCSISDGAVVAPGDRVDTTIVRGHV